MLNDNLLNNMAVASFWLGMKNYEENLSQSDKDDLIKSMERTNKELLIILEADIEKQNAMLYDINSKLDILLKQREEI